MEKCFRRETNLKKNKFFSQAATHQIVAWGKTADVIEKYVVKGKEVAIDGKLTTRSWEDKDGLKRYTTEVVCNELLMLGGK
ncbi:single-stranded DNA-binding protein [Lacinutrix jangbogonensis]|uniref:single-stranded DNA-binding protein n=1 Tax=Lacinutrix jangbogonensis TaxID=1469557 RepID=UPI0009DCA3D3|nr:single-stranded DNA-binding protein [Lacinutrix jangbogonensis]